MNNERKKKNNKQQQPWCVVDFGCTTILLCDVTCAYLVSLADYPTAVTYPPLPPPFGVSDKQSLLEVLSLFFSGSQRESRREIKHEGVGKGTEKNTKTIPLLLLPLTLLPPPHCPRFRNAFRILGNKRRELFSFFFFLSPISNRPYSPFTLELPMTTHIRVEERPLSGDTAAITVHLDETDHEGEGDAGAEEASTASRKPMLPVLPPFTKYGLGVCLILCVTVIWVASSEWIQWIFGALHFDKPYFLTYFNTTGFALWNLGYLLKPSWRELPWDDDEEAQPVCVEDPGYEYLLGAVSCSKGDEAEGPSSPSQQQSPASSPACYGTPNVEMKDKRDSERCFTERLAADPKYRQWNITYDRCRDYAPPTPVGREGDGTSPVRGEEEQTVVEGQILEDDREGVQPVCVRVHRIRRYSKKKIWTSAALFCPFWFLANYLFNLSLSYTSVSSNTIMSAMGTVWTVALSRMFLSVGIGPWKLAGVAICISGSVLVALSSGHDNGSSMAGNLIALLSSFFYAVYTFVLKWCLPDDDRYAMGMVFGAVGVLNFFGLWIGFPVLHHLGVETFGMPTLEQFWPLVVNALIGTNLSDVLWARSVILTSPVVATLGLSLTTPLSMIVDAILHGSSYPVGYVIGALCVLSGFVGFYSYRTTKTTWRGVVVSMRRPSTFRCRVMAPGWNTHRMQNAVRSHHNYRRNNRDNKIHIYKFKRGEMSSCPKQRTEFPNRFCCPSPPSASPLPYFSPLFPLLTTDILTPFIIIIILVSAATARIDGALFPLLRNARFLLVYSMY
eukprot:gene2198-1365_t